MLWVVSRVVLECWLVVDELLWGKGPAGLHCHLLMKCGRRWLGMAMGLWLLLMEV